MVVRAWLNTYFWLRPRFCKGLPRDSQYRPIWPTLYVAAHTTLQVPLILHKLTTQHAPVP